MRFPGGGGFANCGKRLTFACGRASGFFGLPDAYKFMVDMDESGKTANRRRLCLYVLVLASLLTLPFIGLGHFYTRGEPREALVAVSMMEQGNWILPVFQGEFAFKPPMLHWLVALFSLPQGHVSEFTARMPSALAFIVMSVGFFSFFSRRYDVWKVLMATLILMTTFEVHRAAMTCRVDMVLTAFMVGGFMLLYRWWEKGCGGWPWIASLLISGAILTKGPVGAILPCFALAVFMLLRRARLRTVAVALLKTAALSSVLPLCWYVAAYGVGGRDFLDLVMEENFGRFLGQMSYESHENGLFFNVYMLLSGLLPWSIPLVFSLFVVKWRKIGIGKLREWLLRFRGMEPVRQWAVIVTVCVFVFYCIPKSKRSVYLLPLYPFVSLLVADCVVWLLRGHRLAYRVYAVLISAIGGLFSVALFAAHGADFGFLGDSRSMRRVASQLGELQQMPMDGGYVFLALLPLLAVAFVWLNRRRVNADLAASVCVWIAALFALDGVMNPAIKNSVPDYRFAQAVKAYQPDGAVWYYRPEKEETVYTVDFYLDDKVRGFHSTENLPARGFVMLKERSLPGFERLMDAEYDVRRLAATDSEFTSFRGNLLLYKFQRRN